MPEILNSPLLRVRPYPNNNAQFSLLSRIGGNHVRFGLLQENGQITDAHRLNCNHYPNWVEAAQEYYRIIAQSRLPKHAALAVAAPVRDDQIDLTNSDWSFSAAEVEQQLGLTSLTIINDFAAIGLALPYFGAADTMLLQEGHLNPAAAKIVLGADTGLGFAAIFPHLDGSWNLLSTEGGHVTLAASNAVEDHILQRLRVTYNGHVSAERVLSDSGILALYRILSEVAEQPAADLAVNDIIEQALNNQCAICEQVLRVFCEFFGTVASNLALSFSAFGGVYIAGDLTPKFGKLLEQHLLPRFNSKGRFSGHLQDMPVYLITRSFPGLSGLRVLMQMGAG
jgi:glucokinase